MIDATKLVHGKNYWITVRDHSPYVAMYSNRLNSFNTSGHYCYGPDDVTDAIPIPSPEQIAEMWDVIGDVVNSAIEHTSIGKYHVMQIDIDTYETAIKLLEQRT